MLKRFIIFFALIALSQTTFAAEKNSDSNTLSTAAPTMTSSKGFRVAVIKPFLNIDTKIKTPGVVLNGEPELDNEIGLSVGYAYLPIMNLGFTANASFLNMDNKLGDTSHMVRIDGNLAYAINHTLSIKGGANLSNFTDSNFDDIKPNIGFQLGAGLQITKNFGLDISYVMMQQNAVDKNSLPPAMGDLELSLVQQGLELGLHATF
jgi:hypothetical protein